MENYPQITHGIFTKKTGNKLSPVVLHHIKEGLIKI